MFSISLKAIDFTSGEETCQSFDLPVSAGLNSVKSIAYIVRWQLAKRRSGSAKTKIMSEISGTTAKPYKQKGTGNARHGSKRSVQFVGGRTCHGPMPRSFDFSIPKKIVKRAIYDSLKSKLKDNKVVLFSGMSAEITTSKIYNHFVRNDLNNSLVVLDSKSEHSSAFLKSIRNIPKLKVLDFRSVNVYDILGFDKILIEDKVFRNNILELCSNDRND